MKKKIPSFKSDAAAERFVRRADLTRYDPPVPQKEPKFRYAPTLNAGLA